MKKSAFTIAFSLGLLAIVWVAAAVARTHVLVLLMTAVIGAVYTYGALELRRFRAATAALRQALDHVPPQLAQLSDWLDRVPGELRSAVRQRIEGERGALPGPALTPYLIGLLVMLGMLGTFIGMVLTLNGAVFALEGSASVQAMRAAFSEPIKGLGLAFGTSVAGVAASAMLGLMSSLARGERSHAGQALDGLIGTRLQAFSLAHQRHETFRAQQQQSRLLPEVVAQLQGLTQLVARHSEQLGDKLLAQQDRFHREASSAYSGLARSVDETLRGSLMQSMQLASDSIRPVVQDTLADMAQQALTQHERMVDSTRAQWLALQAQQAQADQQRLQADQQRLQAWTAALQDSAGALRSQWQASGEQALERQQQVVQALAATATQLREEMQQHTRQNLGEFNRLLAGSEELVRARVAAEAEAATQRQHHAEDLARLLRKELSALRAQEAVQAEAAVARLALLEAEVAQHLGRLGAALEAPIARLIETASQAPRAAAEVIGQMRQEISLSAARDNAELLERTRILESLGSLLDRIERAASAQQGVAAQITASAVDVASLGEAFGFAVRSFNETHEKLIASLQRIDTAIGQSMARSDEQLAYYVAQARELIDLSIGSQKDVLDALQQRQREEAA